MPMGLLAQLPHHGPVLDLGDARWVLHLFQCMTAGCFTWSYDGGCNAAFTLPRESLGEGLTQAPPAPTENPMHGELWITGWQEHEDAIPHDMRPAYFDVDAFSALPHILQFPHDFGCRLLTKTGGVPYWTRRAGPSGFPPAPFDYLMQIDTLIPIPGRLPDPSALGCDVYEHGANGQQMEARPVPSVAKRENAAWGAMQERERDDEYHVEFANFGSDGTAYVFIDRQTTPPRVMLFWNR